VIRVVPFIGVILVSTVIRFFRFSRLGY
jgi:hypothetical protein